MKKHLVGLVLLALSTGAFAQTPHLVPLTTFGPNGDGSLRPGDRGYLTGANNERGMAYNPVTGHLLIPTRPDFNVYILDAATGADVGNLDMSALTSGGNVSFQINLIGVADDGAIYVGNLCNNDFPPVYNLYRWASETNLQELIFDGKTRDVSNGSSIDAAGYRRYGDTMAVRGAGTNTQVLITSRGTNAVILVPIDDTMTNWNSIVLHTAAPLGGMGFGVAFGTGNTFYATAGASTAGPLLRMGFALGNGTNGTATMLQSFNRSVFPGNVSTLGVSPTSNLLAGIDYVPDADLVRLYDISAPATVPVFLDRQPFPTSTTNDNFAGALAFSTNGLLYALNANHGIMAYTLAGSSAPVAPWVFFQPANQVAAAGSNVTFSASVDGSAPFSYQWRLNETNALAGATNLSVTVSNVQPENAGSYSLVVTNVGGAVTSRLATLTVFIDTSGTLIAYEPFLYTADQLLSAGSSWILNGSGDDTFVTQGSLSVAGLASSVGNSITNGGPGAGVRLVLDTNVSTGPIYYSFAMRVNSVGTAFTLNTGFLSALVSPDGVSQVGRLVPRTNAIAGEYNLGVTKVTSSAAVFATNNFVEGELLFIVCRYIFNSGTVSDDAVSMWINPNPATFGVALPPPPMLTATLTGADSASLDRFTFRQNSSGNTPASISYDELRVGTSWDKVTPPAPPSLKIAATLSTATISWSTNNSAGFVLEGNPDLINTNGWTTVTNSVNVSGAEYVVTVNTATATRFFRLRK
jgi:hypothetical protein